ncbi:MAG TPA: ABC transporter ATP-binding protein [Euzebya sp.]|nr:ABC transporter ATP-binding protein [Euzebya sp.]
MAAPADGAIAATQPLLEVRDLCAGYGASQVLDGLSFSMGVEPVSIIGRNGMGKTTLCATLMGLIRATAGEIWFDGTRLDGRSPEKIASQGVSYVPQGRRLFPSLTVDEHLRMLAKGARGKRWTPEAVYELFPRLAQRRGHGGAELSGGEQQMLAVGRALLLNGRLVVMDEPSEGLAPTIVDVLIDAVARLVAEGVAVLVVEQNIRAATAMAERQLVMIGGRIQAETTAEELLADPILQRRYLGVGHAVEVDDAPAAAPTSRATKRSPS